MHTSGEHAVSHQFHQQATSSPVRVGFCTAIKLVARVSREHKCPGQTAGRKCPYSAPVPFRFLDHSLTGVRSLGLRRAVPPHSQMKQSACLFIRQGLPVRQAGAGRGNRALIKLRCTLQGARCQPSVSSQATSSPARVSSCTASKLVAHVSREHKCPEQPAGRKCPGPVMVPFRFLDRSLTGVRSLGLRRAVPSHTQLKHSACLFIRRGLPVRQAGAVRGNRARIKLRCTLQGSTLSAISFINRQHHRLYASGSAQPLSWLPVSAESISARGRQQGVSARIQHQCLSASSTTRSLAFGRWVCGERYHHTRR